MGKKRADRRETFFVAPIGSPGDTSAAWETAWGDVKRSGYVVCRECGRRELAGFVSTCRKCDRDFVREEARIQIYVAEQPIWDPLFEAQPMQKVRLAYTHAREINRIAPHALKRFSRSRHGPLESLQWAEPHFNTLEAIAQRAKRAWSRPPDWQTMPPPLVNEIVALYQAGRLKGDRLRLPKDEDPYDLVKVPPDDPSWYPEFLKQRERVRGMNMKNPLYAGLSPDQRYWLMRWCGMYRAWGKRLRIPTSWADATAAILREPLVGWLIQERSRHATAEEFLTHLLKLGERLNRLGLPTTRTQLRAKLQQLNVLPRRIRGT